MHKRVNVTLPEETIRLRRLLEEGAERRGARDLAIAEEWFPVDRDAWRKRRR